MTTHTTAGFSIAEPDELDGECLLCPDEPCTVMEFKVGGNWVAIPLCLGCQKVITITLARDLATNAGYADTPDEVGEFVSRLDWGERDPLPGEDQPLEEGDAASGQEVRDCSTCKYSDHPANSDPCLSCVDLVKWEPEEGGVANGQRVQKCSTCKHGDKENDEEPCSHCQFFLEWEPAEPARDDGGKCNPDHVITCDSGSCIHCHGLQGGRPVCPMGDTAFEIKVGASVPNCALYRSQE